MKNIQTTTSIIALSTLIIAFSIPNASATPVSIENHYWHTDPEFCYTSELNSIEIDGSTGRQSVVETELDKVADTYNDALNSIGSSIDIRDNIDDSCPSIYYISHESASLGQYGYTAQADTRPVPGQPTKIHHSTIEYTTDRGFGSDVNVCTHNNKDIEWIANHEVGHSFGLKHHWHFFYDHSVMRPWCSSIYSDVQYQLTQK